MANILLTHSYFLQLDPKQWKMQKPYPPLGTLYAAAVLQEEGHQVRLFDSMLASGPEEIRSHEMKADKYLVIYDDGFNYLTKMCLTTMREAAFQMAAGAKAAGKTVICCSSDSTDHYEKYLDHGVDYVIMGEGEESLRELISKLEAGEKVEDVLGIAYHSGKQAVKNPKRPVMRDLDALPRPAWELVDMERYAKIWRDHHGYFSLNYATTRGCPFKCNWCAKPIYGNRYNSHSPERVAADLLDMQNRFGFDHIWFCDDIFGLKPGWVQEFSEYCLELGLEFSYKIQSRADLLVKDDTVEALAKSGADEVWIGAESGSQRILDAMDKGTTIEQIRESTTLMKYYGIKPCFFLQFGYLNESRNDIQSTIDLLLELMPHDIGISVSYPLPGTKFFDMVKDELEDKANWTDSDDLAMMFRNTYSPGFYRKLQRYVHKLFRREQGLALFRDLFLLRKRIQFSDWRRLILTFYYMLSIPIDKLKLNRLQRS